MDRLTRLLGTAVIFGLAAVALVTVAAVFVITLV